MINKAKCRGCGKELIGKPYYLGGPAYDPETGDQAKTNFYGGFVCSYGCDVRVCLEMSSNMPGAGPAKSLNSLEREQVDRNWEY
ncbi:hypothetical protein LCGC14_1475400 [marine sediment metagenome]|uniref:Uncharacterized protein n=1 Tax=marine sediment metagenome TaxID=412755 RepID=A0A0F9JB45_9ZZZZ